MTAAPVVVVTRPLPEPGVQPLITAGLEVRQHEPDRPPTRHELLTSVTGADALLCLLTERVDGELFDAAPGLKVVANLAVGVDNIDVGAATARGIVVTNTPDVLTEATADLAWAGLLAVARHVVAGDRLMRSGTWEGWSPTQLIGRPVAGRTLGVLGLGAIGTAVARRAAGFGMRVLYTNRRQAHTAEEATDATLVSFEELLAESDVLSVHVPLTDDTHHALDAAALARMKPSAIVVNTSRGPVIDETALLDALRRGVIGGAALDVYEREPAVTEGLADLDNVVLLPHLGSATTEARRGMVVTACANVVEVLGGRPPLTQVFPG